MSDKFCLYTVFVSASGWYAYLGAENRGKRNDAFLLYSPGMQRLEFHSQGPPKVGVRTWYLIADEETCSTGRGGSRQCPWMSTRCREYIPFLGFKLLLLNFLISANTRRRSKRQQSISICHLHTAFDFIDLPLDLGFIVSSQEKCCFHFIMKLFFVVFILLHFSLVPSNPSISFLKRQDWMFTQHLRWESRYCVME